MSLTYSSDNRVQAAEHRDNTFSGEKINVAESYWRFDIFFSGLAFSLVRTLLDPACFRCEFTSRYVFVLPD